MIPLILFLFCVCVAIGTGLLAGLSDFRGMTIPNLYSLVVMGAFVCAFFAVRLAGHGGGRFPLRDLIWRARGSCLP